MKAIEVLEPCASVTLDEKGNVLHYGPSGYYTDEYLGQYTYEGNDFDAQVDCFHNNARIYDPTPGRFFDPS